MRRAQLDEGDRKDGVTRRAGREECKFLTISTSGFYEWLKRTPSFLTQFDVLPRDRVDAISGRSRSTGGTIDAESKNLRHVALEIDNDLRS